MAVDDKGNAFELSADPLLDTVCPYVKDFKLGEVPSKEELASKLHDLLSTASIFGVDLCEIGMCDKVLTAVAEMLEGPGAVASTLEKHLA